MKDSDIFHIPPAPIQRCLLHHRKQLLLPAIRESFFSLPGSQWQEESSESNYTAIPDIDGRSSIPLILRNSLFRIHCIERSAFFRRIRLHTPETSRFFGFCPIKTRHNRPEFFIAVSCCDVDPAGTAMQPAGCHQVPGPDFPLCPSLHVNVPFRQDVCVRYKFSVYLCQGQSLFGSTQI